MLLTIMLMTLPTLIIRETRDKDAADYDLNVSLPL
jgi:hypothetical protein